jgi:hypothetical protein
MNFTCKSNKPTSFDLCMLGLRFDLGFDKQKKKPSYAYRPSLTAKFSKIRLYWNLGEIWVKFGKKISLKFALVQLITQHATRNPHIYSVIWNKETQFILFSTNCLPQKNVNSL